MEMWVIRDHAIGMHDGTTEKIGKALDPFTPVFRGCILGKKGHCEWVPRPGFWLQRMEPANQRGARCVASKERGETLRPRPPDTICQGERKRQSGRTKIEPHDRHQ